ncbi:pyridine nucleotide-disulfide oxidoreductase [Skermanella stibiiresistens SB22]|uniref:Pyridine nucleotide-disulfide oxidoreductase n=1 Tax=Skermanella stibiiresistens SB22 TaxID=1385369 RepID=W9H6C8_9PROT|nr:NAD(P)/FAD-dependent oxidoreductase [Skermanella stibiiresistens]EWY39318.1 pyridine nucleotide-disulfide oxidoreductase [Skermanella stibiiresistens SB22]
MTQSFDIVVVGTGVAGTAIARGCRAAGLSVAIVDELPYGGTCQLRGCDPKKVLRAAVEPVSGMEQLEELGIFGAPVTPDWRSMMAFKRRFTDPVTPGKEAAFAEAGIAKFHGTARFADPDTLMVGDTVLKGGHFALAAGSRPADLPIDGAELLLHSDGFMALDTLPRRIVLVGGGYIAMEFAHIAVRAGAEVTMLQRGERLLDGFDPDLVDLLVERTHDMPVDIRVGTAATAIERVGEGYRVHADQEGRALRFESDLVVHAAGRAPNLDGLDLQAGGVAFGKRGIEVDDHLRSVSNPRVFAAGDAAASGMPLTPKASHDAAVVVANLTRGGHSRRVDYTAMPSVVFSLPPLARVGLLEEEALHQGLGFRVNHAVTDGWFSAKRLNETCSGHKVLIEEGTGRILGAHLVGPHADEVINLFALAIRHGITAEGLAETPYSYPTSGSDVASMV